MKKLETVFALTIRVLVYACAIAGGITLGIGIADSITACEFNNVALLLPAQIAAGTFAGGFATVVVLALVAGLFDL